MFKALLCPPQFSAAAPAHAMLHRLLSMYGNCDRSTELGPYLCKQTSHVEVVTCRTHNCTACVSQRIFLQVQHRLVQPRFTRCRGTQHAVCKTCSTSAGNSEPVLVVWKRVAQRATKHRQPIVTPTHPRVLCAHTIYKLQIRKQASCRHTTSPVLFIGQGGTHMRATRTNALNPSTYMCLHIIHRYVCSHIWLNNIQTHNSPQ